MQAGGLNTNLRKTYCLCLRTRSMVNVIICPGYNHRSISNSEGPGPVSVRIGGGSVSQWFSSRIGAWSPLRREPSLHPSAYGTVRSSPREHRLRRVRLVSFRLLDARLPSNTKVPWGWTNVQRSWIFSARSN